jgi:uncharacterized integral membrane protein (TIGR00698 family)
VCLLITLAATFVSEHYGGPPLLYALLMGLALHFLSTHVDTAAGIAFCARTVLRIGVALLGARITIAQVSDLGWQTAAVLATATACTIAVGVVLARVLRRPRDHGLLSGAAVGICGVSAALAVSSVLPATRENERFTLLTVVGVTILSTICMVLYPLVLAVAAIDAPVAGLFLGATIHDVAQVVAAGTLLGPEAADNAVIAKLYRVALLAPAAMLIALLVRRGASTGAERVPLLPGFMVAFIALVLLASVGAIQPQVAEFAADASRWCLVTAIAACGLKTHLQELAKLGWQPLVMLLTETLLLAFLIASWIFIAKVS